MYVFLIKEYENNQKKSSTILPIADELTIDWHTKKATLHRGFFYNIKFVDTGNDKLDSTILLGLNIIMKDKKQLSYTNILNKDNGKLEFSRYNQLLYSAYDKNDLVEVFYKKTGPYHYNNANTVISKGKMIIYRSEEWSFPTEEPESFRKGLESVNDKVKKFHNKSINKTSNNQVGGSNIISHPNDYWKKKYLKYKRKYISFKNL